MIKVADIFQEKIYGSEEYKQMHKKRPSFPIVVDIEPTNACNLDCIFCQRQVMKRPLKILPFELYKNIIDEISNHESTSVRFSGWGEPTLHPKIVDFVSYARKKGVLTHLTTNGTLLDSKLSYKLLKADLNKIKMSLQGLNEAEYNRMRRPKNDEDPRCGYKNITRNMEEFIRIRNELNTPCHIQVSVSMLKKEQENLSGQQAFYDYWYPKVDSIWGLGKVGVYGGKPLLTSFQRVKDFGKISEKDLAQGRPLRVADVNKGKKCDELYNKISIGSDGAMKACCDDADNNLVVGWIGKQTIKEVWDGKILRKLRENIESNNPKRVPKFCLNCDNYF